MSAAVLEISSRAGSGFYCGLQGWLQDFDQKSKWRKIVAHIVQFAYISRPATIINVSPAPWSFGHSLPAPRKLTVKADEYLVSHVSSCSLELLTEMVESEDFQRGLLWLATLPAAGDTALLEMLGSVEMYSENAPLSNSEVLVLLDDSRRVHWLHPAGDVGRLHGEVIAFAASLHWETINLED